MGTIKEEIPVLIYDKDCLICRKAAQWVERNIEGTPLELLPCHAEVVKDRLPDVEGSACMKAMQFILPGGRVLSGERALPEIISRLNRYQWLACLFKLPGSGIFSRAFYRWFANRRYRIARILFRDKTRN